MAEFVTAYSSGWKPSGADVYRHFRGWASYSTVLNATSMVISMSGGCQLDHSASSKTYTGAIYIGSVPASGTCTFTYSSSSPVNKKTTASLSQTIARGTSAKTVTLTVRASYSGDVDAFVNSSPLASSVNITVPALDSYTVSYDANGGEDAPGSQTKWYGINLTLSSNIPTKYKYAFVEWNTEADGTGVSYNPGSTYTGDASITLYAIWQKVIPDFYVKVNNTWRNSEPYIKVNGQWRLITEAYTKVNGVWKDIT